MDVHVWGGGARINDCKVMHMYNAQYYEVVCLCSWAIVMSTNTSSFNNKIEIISYNTSGHTILKQLDSKMDSIKWTMFTQ